MEEKITEFAVEYEAGVVITKEEYRELIACQTMLDMMLESARKEGGSYATPNHVLVAVAQYQRQLYRPCLTASNESGDSDA